MLVSRLPVRVLRPCVSRQYPLFLHQHARPVRYLSTPAEPTPSEKAAPSSSSSYPRPPTRLPPIDHVATSEKELRSSKPPQLIRPIGLPNPPQPGENSGVDSRSWQQWRDDFVDYDKHLDKRRRMTNEMATPYFRDFSRMSKQFKGKSWIAPSLLFKADKSLFFPNLVGRTLNTSERLNTTHTLLGNVSVVGVFSSVWAESQIKSFMDGLEAEVPAFEEGWAQRVDINIEENWLKAAIIKMFIPRLQAQMPLEQHDRYFIVTKGVSLELRHDMGLWNGRVGYVYLIDWNCRIRWAGSGNAEPEERAALVKGIKRLADEWKQLKGHVEIETAEE